jgi:hypothetical protein
MTLIVCLAAMALAIPSAQAAGCVDCQTDDETSLLQVMTEVSRHGASAGDDSKQEQERKRPLPHGWFGAFSEAESTYTGKGRDSSLDNPEHDALYGLDPGRKMATSYMMSDQLSPTWFHESMSGGASHAWQTGYPNVPNGVPGNRQPSGEGSWRNTPTGWHDDYRNQRSRDTAGPPAQEWFDNGARQIDGFSRESRPDKDQGAFYSPSYGWMERTVNTSLSCKEIDCTAAVSLQVFNPDQEEAKLCRLSFMLHPTDYDDDWSREHLEFLRVNNVTLTKECNPRARGCNMTAERPLYPCLNSFNVDKVINEIGTLHIQGKNTHMVDECPYEGNLLSGVAMVTCNIRKKYEPPPIKSECVAQPKYAEGVLKCSSPGCNASELLQIDTDPAKSGGVCCMNVSVVQTDYDDHLGLPEQVDFIQIANLSDSKGNDVFNYSAPNTIIRALSPGHNPCNQRFKGYEFRRGWVNLVNDEDVTHWVNVSSPPGILDVRGRISPQVDECGYKGNLFYSLVSVVCTPPLPDSCNSPKPTCKKQWKSTATAVEELNEVKSQLGSSEPTGQLPEGKIVPQRLQDWRPPDAASMHEMTGPTSGAGYDAVDMYSEPFYNEQRKDSSD